MRSMECGFIRESRNRNQSIRCGSREKFDNGLGAHTRLPDQANHHA